MNASGITTAFIGNHTEWNVTSQEMTRYYLAGGQRIAFRVIKSGQADKVFYLLADHLGSTNVVMQVGGVVETKTYTAWGKDRTGSITNTDRQYTGQINESELGLYFYNARYYDPDLGRFISADTIIPQPGNPMAWDRYAYTRNNPIRFTDPSGHIDEDQSEEANDIVNQLLEYGVKVKVDWGERQSLAIYWDNGKWTLEMLQNLIGGVQQLANAMGGIGQFNTNLNGVTVVLRSMKKEGLSKAHKVILNASGFSIWTVIHEFAHSWDTLNGNNFSRTLEKETDGETKWFPASNCTSTTAPGCNHVGYYYGGTPPKGSNYGFDRKEDFAESVATYVLGVDLAFITKHYPTIKEFHYTDFTNTPRWNYVDSLMTK